MSKHIGRQAAYHLLPPLVKASYHTTYPVTAFASLLQSIHYQSIDFNKTNPINIEAELLDRLYFTLGIETDEVPNIHSLATDDPFAFINEKLIRKWIEEFDYHPLNLLARHIWITEDARHGWMYNPFQFIKENGRLVRNDFKFLEPPFTWLVYDSDDVPLGATILLLSEPYRGKKVSKRVDPQGQTEFQTYLDMLLFRRVLVEGLFRVPGTPTSNFCHHEVCDLFNSGLCNNYIRIPDKPNECPFPFYMLHTIKRYYLKESNLLKRRDYE